MHNLNCRYIFCCFILLTDINTLLKVSIVHCGCLLSAEVLSCSEVNDTRYRPVLAQLADSVAG